MTEGKTYLTGLIGWPVEHSISPAMHNAAFETLALPWRYGLLPTRPDAVESVLAGLQAHGYRGANVTVPHKQAVMAYLDKIDPAAEAVGAVNTIVVRRDGLAGYNTDGYGFVASLRERGFEVEGRRALVLGSGGAARSVVCALVQAGCQTTIHNRTLQRAHILAGDLARIGARPPVAASLTELDLGTYSLLVNGTSVGMWPQDDASPWPVTLPMPDHWTVFDLVYNPAETALMAQARAAGATVIGGLGMLVHQGAEAFKLWTGLEPPIDIMRAAAMAALGI
jgi:shikimate dehydrogenase